MLILAPGMALALTVTYNANGSTSGTVPVDSSTYASGDMVTVLDNPGGLAKTGDTFTGWNTLSDGSGNSYASGDTFAIGATSDTLYVKWTADTYTVTFDSQGGSAVAPITGIASGDTVTLPTAPTKVGFTFASWNTAANGSGTAFTAATAITDNVTVYAQWTSSGGGGGGAVVHTPTVQTEAASTITTYSAVLNGDITSDNGYAITDYGFLWGTSSSGLTNKLDVGTDNHSGAFTDTLSSLTAGTTYYFQAYATNSYGTADGLVMSFVTTTTTPPTAPVFSDVSASYWGYNAISNLSSKGIVSGYPDGTFKPEVSITRAEFATMLVRALGLNTSGTTGRFTDVTADAWYYGYVNAAASAGLVAGIGNNMFAPNALITREEMAVMVAQALGTKAPTVDGTELNAFSDKSAVSWWAKTEMEEAVKAGIVSGMTADTLVPQADATRAQAAEMIFNLLNVLGK